MGRKVVGMQARHAVMAAVGWTVTVAGFAAVMVVHPGGDGVTSYATVVDGVGTSVAGLGAAAMLAWRGHRCTGSVRWSWWLLAMGVFGAGLGDTIWSGYALVARSECPFPSVADAAYLTFPVLTGAGLLTYQADRRSGALTVRPFFDGVLVSTSLFALTWVTALGAVVRGGADSRFAFAISLAYPVTDLVLLTVTVLILARGNARGQISLRLIGVALVVMTLGDMAFTYIEALGTYGPGSPFDTAFLAAYLLMALAAAAGSPPPRELAESLAPPSRWATSLPYLMFAVGLAVSVGPMVHRVNPVQLATAVTLAATLLVRQMLTITDNRRLLAAVAERERRLHHQAFHDDLTGLANRALFADRLDHALAVHAPDRRSLAVLFLDLDDFKVVNDSLGHDAGDALLVRVAERLRAAAAATDTVARLGGDEFALLVEDSLAPVEAATRVSEAFAQPFVVHGQPMRVAASLGVATTDVADGWPVAPELLKQADMAMYAAKRGGRGDFVFFTPVLSEASDREFDIRDSLARSIAAAEIGVAFQPILDTITGRVLGFEALARWTRHGTPVPPDVFLPVARRLGLIVELDLLVLNRALTELARWRATPSGRELTCAVNANESLLEVPDAAGIYADALRRHGLPTSALVVELPERHLSDSATLVSTVAGLRQQGIAVALDDFGTHDSSLARLHRIRVDTVKLDRDFLVPGPDGTIDEGWLGGVIDLAHRLGTRVVAEGLETVEQLQVLRRLACDAVQGYLLGRPVPAPEVRLPSGALAGPLPIAASDDPVGTSRAVPRSRTSSATAPRSAPGGSRTQDVER